MDLMIEDLMEQLVEGGGSDLHIATGQPPYGRFSGELRPMRDDPLEEEDCNKLIFSMLNNSQRKTLEQTWELDCAYGLKGWRASGSTSTGRREAMPPVSGPSAARSPVLKCSTCRPWCWRPANDHGDWCW